MHAIPKPSDLHVALFDGPRLFMAGEEIPLSLYQACALALVYGHGPRGLSVDRFAALLWEEDDSPAARQRIRQLFYTIRSKVGGTSVITRTTNRLQPNHEVSCDFLNGGVASAGEPVDETGEAFLRSLPPPPPEVERWVTATRAGLRTQSRALLHRRLKMCQTEGDLEGAIDACESLLRIDGDRKNLLSSLEILQRRLAEDRALSGRPVSVKHRPEHWTRTGWNRQAGSRLIGRSTFLELLAQRVLSHSNGLTLAAVLGEAGIGKTAVCKEVIEVASNEGMAIGSSTCAELESGIALTPLVEIFKDLSVFRLLKDIGEPWVSVLRNMAPTIFGSDRQPPDISPGSVSNRLMESVRRVLQAISLHKSTLLVIDDAQWIDQTSLSALAYTARRWEAGPLSILLSARLEDMEGRPKDPTSQFLSSLVPNAARFELTPLEDGAAREMILAAGGEALPEEEQQRVQSAAGGNPLFLVELTRAALSDSTVRAPHSLQNVVEQRLGQASNTLREVSALLAVAGPLAANMIAQVVGVSLRSCRRTLREGIRLSLLEPQDDGTWGFRHSALSDAVREGVTGAQARALNSELADVLIEQRAQGCSGRIALLCSRAARRTEARHYARLASQDALEVGALSEAVRFVDLALENVQDPDTEVELLAESGRLKLLQSRTLEAAPLLEIASARYRRSGHRDAAIGLSIDKYAALSESGLIPQARGVIELQALVDEAWGLDLEQAALKGYEVMIRILERLERPIEIRAILRKLQPLSLEDPEAAADRDMLLALDLFYDDGAVADEATRRGLARARELASPHLMRKASLRRALVLLYLGRGGSAEGSELRQNSIDEAERGGDLRLHHTALVNAGCWFLDTGAVDEAERYFARAQELQARLRSATAEIRHLGNSGVVALSRGNLPLSEEFFRQAEDRLDHSVPRHARHFINAGLGLTAVLSGRLSEARRRAAQIPHPDHWYFSPVLPTRLRAEIARRIGDYDGAIRILQNVSDAVSGRMRPASLTLQVELVRFLNRNGNRNQAREVALAGEEVARGLGIHTRAQLFRSLC